MKDLLKRMNALTVIMLLALSIVFVGCSDDDDPSSPKKTESELLIEYLETTGGDFINTSAPALTNAIDVKNMNLATPEKIHIIDIRSAADFANLGHIKNAVNKTIPELYNYFKSGFNSAQYEKVVIVCYTGQSASYATSLLRLLGYNNVTAMKFGMSSWHEDFANSYKNIIANGNSKASQFVTTETAKPTALVAMPTLATGKTTGKDILEERVKMLFEKGFSSSISNADACAITNADLFTDLSKYFIANYWPANHYANPGHIPGAMQYTPKESLKSTTFLKTLPTDKPVVVYCYTGQTSAHVAAFLRVLGYNAKSLQFGCTGMIYDLLVAGGLSTYKPATDIIGAEYEK